MGTIPTPFDGTAAQKLTAALLDAGLRDPLNWILGISGVGHPRVFAFDNVGVSCTNATATLITWSAENYDTDTMHDTASNTSRIVCNTAGVYEFDFQLSMPAVAYTNQDLNIRLNAAGSSAGGTSLRTQPFSDGTRGVVTVSFRFYRSMAVSDYLEAFMNQSSGGARVTSATSLGTRVYARFIAAA